MKTWNEIKLFLLKINPSLLILKVSHYMCGWKFLLQQIEATYLKVESLVLLIENVLRLLSVILIFSDCLYEKLEFVKLLY